MKKMSSLAGWFLQYMKSKMTLSTLEPGIPRELERAQCKKVETELLLMGVGV